MLVFYGGLTLEQVEKFKNNEFVIFVPVPYNQVLIPHKNTFDYYPRNSNLLTFDCISKYVSDDMYQNQYIFLFKYLRNALEFCVNSDKKNYILVLDMNEDVLDNFVGVGRYYGNQLEYRVPRKYIPKESIVDFLYFEPFISKQCKAFRERFPDSYFSELEDEEASEILKVKKLVFNEYK